MSSVRRDGDQFTVTGNEDALQAVITVLIRHGIIAQHLRVDQANLDDAFVALTGHGRPPGRRPPRRSTKGITTMSFSAAIPVPGRAWRMLTLTELKLLLRTPAALFWGVGFPLVGLIVLGLIPGTGKPVKAFGGASVRRLTCPHHHVHGRHDGGAGLPATLVSYRERGILRRMFTTPVTRGPCSPRSSPSFSASRSRRRR